MTRDDGIKRALAALDEPTRQAMEPLLRALVHDLNGLLSTVTLEGFALDQLATKLGAGASAMSEQQRAQLTSLQDAARNLRQAANAAAAYLELIESHARRDDP